MTWELSKKFKMASKMHVIFKEYYLYVRTSSGQADIFRIGPEKSVERHTKSSGESLWSVPRNPRWRPKWTSFSKNITCMLELAQNKLKFSEYVQKYQQNNILNVLKNPPGAFQEIQDGVQNGHHFSKNISRMLEIAHNKLKFSGQLWKYGQNNTLQVLENPPAAFQK